MPSSSILRIAIEMPKFLISQVTRPIRAALRRPRPYPETQQAFSQMASTAITHEIRAGYDHRFITLLFVTVDDRVFCRRYSYNEPSWHGVFRRDPVGQVKLDKTVVNITAHRPDDLTDILPAVDQAYADKLRQLGASFLMSGAVDPRAQDSTLELSLADKNAHLA